jgi:pSer/pThr/pTyr-binding forkhead associated (FHA) protein
MFDRVALRRSPSPTQEESAASLTLTIGEAERSIRFQRPLVIGRGVECDLPIDDDAIGERHAEIYPVGALWWVRDLGSEDGTYLNDEIIEAAPLEIPSVLRLGAAGPTLRLAADG